MPAPLEAPRPSWVTPLAAALTCAFGVYALYRFFVGTALGQRLDALAFAGARIGAWRISGPAYELLSWVSVAGIAAVVAIVMVIALARREWVLSLEAAGVVAGANITTQVLKHVVLTRVPLVPTDGPTGQNSLPSGHTTVAASVAVAGVLVVPAALRALTSALAAVVSVAFGYATLIGQWHRPSDIMAAILVAFGWGYAAVALGRLRERRAGASRLLPARGRAGGTIPILLTVSGGVALLVSLAAAVAAARISSGDESRTVRLVCYLGGTAGIVGVTCCAAALLLMFIDAQSRGATGRGSAQ